jgi:hypothetical protein
MVRSIARSLAVMMCYERQHARDSHQQAQQPNHGHKRQAQKPSQAVRRAGRMMEKNT